MGIDSITGFFTSNWEIIGLVFMIADKVVAVSPTKKDDLILHYLKKLFGKG